MSRSAKPTIGLADLCRSIPDLKLTTTDKPLASEINDLRCKTEKEKNEIDIEGFSLSSLQTYKHTDILHFPPFPFSLTFCSSLSACELVLLQVLRCGKCYPPSVP
jgi:hypothetical protein